MEKHGEAPGIAKDYQIGLSGKEVNKERLGARSHLSGRRMVVDSASEAWIQQVGPDEESLAISSLLEIGEQAVDNVRLGGEQVDGVHVMVRFAPFFDSFDGGNVMVENVVFLDSIVDKPLGAFIED